MTFLSHFGFVPGCVCHLSIMVVFPGPSEDHRIICSKHWVGRGALSCHALFHSVRNDSGPLGECGRWVLISSICAWCQRWQRCEAFYTNVTECEPVGLIVCSRCDLYLVSSAGMIPLYCGRIISILNDPLCRAISVNKAMRSIEKEENKTVMTVMRCLDYSLCPPASCLMGPHEWHCLTSRTLIPLCHWDRH